MNKSRTIGQCIYCRTAAGRLTDEHIVPYGLNGDIKLLKASCDDCARITSRFELRVLRESLFVARAALGAKTRRKNERDELRSMIIVKDGVEQTINVHWRDHWKFIVLPVFEPPAFLDGRPYTAGIEAHRADTFSVEESPQEIAKRHEADDVVHKIHNPHEMAYAYAKLVAKIAYGIAIERFGISGLKEAYVVPAILGKSDDIGRWVGCDGERLMAHNKYHLWATRLNVSDGLITVRVKLFASINGTEYVVVVGRLKEEVQGFLQSVGYGGA